MSPSWGRKRPSADLDRALWTFTALDFVPHCRSNAPATVRERTSIVLAPDAVAAQGHADVLLNLGTVCHRVSSSSSA